METLMGSCWKIFFPLKFGERERLIWRPVDVSLSTKENGFARNKKRVGFSLSVSFHCKIVRSVSSVAYALSPENQTLVESEETDQMLVADQPKTAHIQFKLTKKCAFGQHFLVAGDDPRLGLWDPSDGVPFDWSDGHVWTAELDLPCRKMIKYKFILKVDDKTISWQPGPNRILETWETENTIIVFEDWDHPELQAIAEEEELTAYLNDEKSLINSESLTVPENLSKTTHVKKKQLAGTNEHSSLDDNVKQDLDSNGNYLKHEESSGLEQEAPVLLPGLIPTLTNKTDEESPNEDEELKDEHISDSLRSTETSEVVMENENGIYGSLDDNVKQDLNRNRNYLKREESPVLEQEAPVLLPGLIPTLTNERDRESPNEDELKDEHISASLRSPETSEVVMENEKGIYGSLDDNVKQDLNRNRNYLKDEESSVLEQEAPVLLPGLIPTLTNETDEESPNEDEELKDEHISDSSTETSEVVMENEKGIYGSLDDNAKQDLNRNRNYLKHEESSVLEQEAPVLLPSLIPTLTNDTDEESPNEDELKDERISPSRSTETSEVVMENEKGIYGKEQLEISDGDMQWDRGILKKFFTIFGF